MSWHTLTILMTLSTCVLVHAGFIWAVIYYFRRESHMTWQMQLLSASGIACQAAHVLGILFWPASESRLIIGIVCYLSSAALFWSALATNWRSRLRLAFTDGAMESLPQSGPYRYVRHPIYASYLLSWSAGAVAIESLFAIAPLLIMGAQYWVAVRREENEFLASALGLEYQRYMQTTGALTPRLWRRRGRGKQS